MNRTERKKQIKRLRRRSVFAVLLCVLLFYAGLSIVDASTREMLGNGQAEPIFGIQNQADGSIRLNIVGETFQIDKNRINSYIQDIKNRIERLITD
ncbi:MAG: hypothetical protein QME73_00770 [Bacillota bacterium]|nr:hypothetical protein [Bacillota bacterium]